MTKSEVDQLILGGYYYLHDREGNASMNYVAINSKKQRFFVCGSKAGFEWDKVKEMVSLNWFGPNKDFEVEATSNFEPTYDLEK